ncbi:MAG: glucuronate isomerase [Candidatus Fimadaptatus sp.]|jgi:glucuronate isomerase
MKKFMGENFLLTTESARKLYHDYAETMPILDYHCHINPEQIATDYRFSTITEAWLGGDHYKWRLMRNAGVEERYITGDASDWEKFQAYARVLPRAVGNPLYHWTHLELKRYFGCDLIINEENARQIYDWCNERLKEPDMSVRGIIKRSNVKLICTTDDPVDDLHWHEVIAADPTCEVKVLPAWRPDKAVNIDKPGFADYVRRVGEVSGYAVDDIAGLYSAIRSRLDFFGKMGCVASDHGLDYVPYAPASDEEIDAIYKKALAGGAVTADEAAKYQTAMLLFFGREYAERGWAMQIHYSALRNPNARMFRQLGPDSGFDSMGQTQCLKSLSQLMNALEEESKLPRMVLYSLNSADNEILDVIAGAFQDSSCAGKIQHGSAWWFNDTKTGMEAQMTSLANLGVLGNFIGMLTDSRSFLSYTRHEYFRRIMCNLIGGWMEEGEYPADFETAGQIVKDISFNNAVRFFGFNI